MSLQQNNYCKAIAKDHLNFNTYFMHGKHKDEIGNILNGTAEHYNAVIITSAGGAGLGGCHLIHSFYNYLKIGKKCINLDSEALVNMPNELDTLNIILNENEFVFIDAFHKIYNRNNLTKIIENILLEYVGKGGKLFLKINNLDLHRDFIQFEKLLKTENILLYKVDIKVLTHHLNTNLQNVVDFKIYKQILSFTKFVLSLNYTSYRTFENFLFMLAANCILKNESINSENIYSTHKKMRP